MLDEQQSIRIGALNDFRSLLVLYQKGQSDEVRAEINQKRAVARRYVKDAGCWHLWLVAPPPMVGGMVGRNIDLFEHMFTPMHGVSVIEQVIDMIDSAIGVISDPDWQVPTLPAVPSSSEAQGNSRSMVNRGSAFIAMAIDANKPELVDVLDTIKQAASACGIIAMRIDEDQSNDRITDRIVRAIQLAEFVIVDLTERRPNVFFEAGYAHGLSKLPIYIARNGTTIDFDVKDYPIIFFANMRDLKQQLETRLRALQANTQEIGA